MNGATERGDGMSDLFAALGLWLNYRAHRQRAWRQGLAVEDFVTWVARGSRAYRDLVEGHRRAEDAARIGRMAELRLAADAERSRVLAEIDGVTA